MYTIDVWELKGKIASRGFNVSTLAKEIGVSRNTLSKYMGRPEIMPHDVIAKLISVLNIEKEQVVPIFFSKNLTLKERTRQSSENLKQ